MKAYELIDSPDKWAATDPIPSNKNCLVTAITAAYGNEPWPKEQFDKLYNKLGKDAQLLAWNFESGWETVYNTLKELDI